jgi:hypothetical protein
VKPAMRRNAFFRAEAVCILLFCGVSICGQGSDYSFGDPLTTTASPTYLDPQQFGNCHWDGTHDVAPCIQAAINAGVTKVVRLPPGVWLIGQSLNVPANTALQGEANRTVLRPTTTNGTDPILLRIVDSADILVEDLIFDGGGQDFGNPNPVIGVTHSEGVVFDRISVENTRGRGIVIHDGVTRSGVRNSRLIHVGNHWKTTADQTDRIQGLVFCCGEGNEDNFAIGNYFEDIGLDALQFSNQFRFVAADNTFKLENNQHASVKSADFPAAIFPMYSTNSIIVHNSISGAQGCGIDAPGLQQSVISTNSISDSQSCGVGLFLGYDKVTQASGVLVIGNVINNNVRWKNSPFKGGVTIAGGAPSNITISGNTISNVQGNRSQLFGVQVLRNTQVTGLTIDRNNELSGNAIAPFDDAHFSEPKTAGAKGPR